LLLVLLTAVWLEPATAGAVPMSNGARPASNGARPPADTMTDWDQCPRVAVEMEVLSQDGDGTVLFRGEHVRSHDGPLLRIEERFTDRDGRVVMTTESAYGRETLVPVHYRREHPLSGAADWLRVTPQGVELGNREADGGASTVRTVPLEQHDLFGPSMVDFVRREFEALAAGRRLSFPLLVPSRTERYWFRMERTQLPGAPDPGRVALSLEPDNLVLRQFVNPLLFVFESVPPHRLLEYHGQSSLRSGEVYGKPVRIVYRYPATC
jgi:hypothetical protein